MPILSGQLADFGLNTLPGGTAVKLTFIPAGPALDGGTLRASREIPATIVGQAWTASLVQTDHMVPAMWFTPRIRWFEGGVMREDVLVDIRVFMPAADTDIGSISNVPIDALTGWYSDDPPPPGFKGLWLQPTSGEIGLVY